MDALDFASKLVWPGIVIGLAVYYRRQFGTFLDRAASFKIKVLGSEIELTAREAENALKELITDVTSLISDMTDDERLLYIQIRAADGRKTVEELLPMFVRGNAIHKRLQLLRDRKLIRPFEGSSWETYKHPIVTRFSRLVERIYPEMLRPNERST